MYFEKIYLIYFEFNFYFSCSFLLAPIDSHPEAHKLQAKVQVETLLQAQREEENNLVSGN